VRYEMSLDLGEERPSPLTGEDRLREAIRRYSRTKRQKGLTIDQKPGCIYGMLLGDDVKDMQGDLDEIKKTLRGIYVSVFLMLLGLIADIALRGMR